MTAAAPNIMTTRTQQRDAAERKSVVIVGAGPGGLAAALILAHAGLKVTVLERLPRVGGRCSSITEQGFKFDLGPTFFLYPRVLERIYRLLGKDLHQEIPMVKLDPQYRIIFGDHGGDLVCTPDISKMAEAVAKLDPHDGANVRRFIEENRNKLERFRPALESPFRGLNDLLTWDLLKLLPLIRPWKSVDGELKRYFRDQRTRLAFSFQSKYLGMSPFNCPSLFTILSYLEYDFGVWHPIGGCNAVSEGMARTARELGVDIRLEEPVTELIYQGKQVIGVKTKQGSYTGNAVVMNADFAHAMTNLVPNQRRRKWTNEKLAKKRYSCSTFMLYLGIRGRYDHLHHHTIYTSSNYIQNLKEIETDHRLSEDPSIYVQNACVTDDTLAPEGMSTIYILAPVSHLHKNIDWNREREGFRAKVLQQAKKLGMPDLEDRIVYEKVVTPVDWEQSYAVYRGATFNLAHNLGQMLHLRPQNRFMELPGVYLVGGGTHPGSGLPVIYESARISSRLLLEDLNLDYSWLGAPGASDDVPVAAMT